MAGPKRSSGAAFTGKFAVIPLGDPSVNSTMVFKASGSFAALICWYPNSRPEMVFVLDPQLIAPMLPETVAMESGGFRPSNRWAVRSKVTKPILSKGLNKVMKF